MTSRERVLAALRHEKTDKPPFSIGFGVNQYAQKKLAEHLGKTLNQVNRMLIAASDLRWVAPDYIGPSYRTGGSAPDKPDIWGVKHKSVFNGFDSYFEISESPLQGLGITKKLEDHEFPSPDWFDYNSLAKRIDDANNDGDYAIVLGNGNIFETSWYMAGFEDTLALLLTEPELANQLMEKVTDFFIEFFQRALTAVKGRINIVFTADDIGQQAGLLMALPLWEKLLKPHHVRMNKVLHSFGVKIMYHTDGSVMEAIDGLVDMGIDVFEAIQFDAKGMDPAALKKNWGDRLCFHGGISVQSTLPFGSPEDVRREVHERLRVLGESGGYILAPSHAIQGGTPPENIIAFLEEAGRFFPDQPDKAPTSTAVITF
jgi:uroporphyrinogen decarboxylase